MNNNARNIDILEHIVKYCDEIFETIKYFGNSFETFKSNSIYRNAISMCVLQIGELTGHLSDSFKEMYNEVPWKNIKGMRNFMAHKYGDISISTVWEAIAEDVPELRNYCNSILEKHNVLEESALMENEENSEPENEENEIELE